MCVIIARNVPASAGDDAMRTLIAELRQAVLRTFPSYVHEVSVIIYPSGLVMSEGEGSRPVVSFEMVSDGERSRSAFSHLLGFAKEAFKRRLGLDPECYVRGMVICAR